MKRVERTALPKATSHDLKDLCEGAPFKCPKCLKMISLKWWSLYNNNNIWSFPSCTASLLSNYKFGPGMQIFNDLLCCQNQQSPAQHITETQEEIILLWCEPTSYCTITEAQSYRWCSGGKMACFLSTGTVLLTAKPSSPVMSRCNHCIFPVYSFVYMFPSLRRTNCVAPSESDPVWLSACKHFLSLHTIQRVRINPKRRLVKTV